MVRSAGRDCFCPDSNTILAAGLLVLLLAEASAMKENDSEAWLLWKTLPFVRLLWLQPPAELCEVRRLKRRWQSKSHPRWGLRYLPRPHNGHLQNINVLYISLKNMS